MDRAAESGPDVARVRRVYWALALCSVLDLVLVVSSGTYRTAMGDVDLGQVSSLVARLGPGVFNGSLCVLVAVRINRPGRVRTALVCGASSFYAMQGALGLVPFAGYLVALASPIAPLYMAVLLLFGTDGVYIGMALMVGFSLLSVWMIIVTLRVSKHTSVE